MKTQGPQRASIADQLVNEFDAMSSHKRREPSVGVEHEFFLLEQNGKPVTLEASQDFLRRLSEQKGWKIQQKHPKNDLILRVSKEVAPGKYTAGKYEFPSHLLEMAFSWHHNLNSLREDVFSTWNLFFECAFHLGLKIASVPLLSPSTVLPHISLQDQSKVDDKFKFLASSRRAQFTQRGEPINESIADFPSFLAATQIQIGGFNWWSHSPFVSRAYVLESLIAPYSYLLSTKNIDQAFDLFHQRWSYYQRVFKGMKLLGFPEFFPERAWNLEDWSNCVSASRLLSDGDRKTPRTFSEFIADNSNESVVSSLTKIRDLQIIRPKSIGTLEFRGDPAVSSPEHIVALAALRLGQALVADQSQSQVSVIEYQEARARWLAYSQGDSQLLDGHINALDLIYSALEKRHLGEEKYLLQHKHRTSLLSTFGAA